MAYDKTDVVNHVLLGIDTYRVTSDYGNRTILIGGQYVTSFHGGIDLTPASPIVAMQKGKVRSVRNSVLPSQTATIIANKQTSLYAGNFVTLTHGNGEETRYYHLKEGSVVVNVGDVVEKGQVIGFMGKTGYVTGTHLHFEIRKDGKTVDPIPYLEGKLNLTPFFVPVEIDRANASVIIPKVNLLNYREKPGTASDNPSLGKLNFGQEYPYSGITKVDYDGFKWVLTSVDGKDVYVAYNPNWIDYRIPKEIVKETVIKEVEIPIDTTLVDGDLVVTIKKTPIPK